MDKRFFPRWRTRTWLVLAWTAAMIAAVVVIENVLAAPDGTCPPGDDYCAIGQGAGDAASSALEVVVVVIAVIIWAVGFGAIRYVARLISEELPRRRQLRAIAAERERELRRF